MKNWLFCKYFLIIRYKVNIKAIYSCNKSFVWYNREYLYGGNMARVLISMSNDFLNKVDSVATSEQRTRSELIREALRVYIKRNKISNNLKAEENATILTELLG